MNSSFLRGVVATGVPFGMGIYFSFRYGIPGGALAGFASGIFFGLAMTLFAQKQRERMGAKGGVFEGEDVLHEGPANHFKRAEGRGGWLTLTANKLSFRSPWEKHSESTCGYQPFRYLESEINTDPGDCSQWILCDQNGWNSGSICRHRSQ